MDVVLDNQFNDLELLAAGTRAWDLDFRLTQKGGFSGRMRQVALPYLLITYARLRNRLHQSGGTPPGFRTFALPADGCQGFWWLAYDVDDTSVLRFGTDSELACASDGDFAVYTLSLRDDYLEQLTASLGVPDIPEDRGVLSVSAAQMTHLRELARTATFQPSAQLRVAAAHQLAQRLTSCCATGEKLQKPSSRSRDRAISRIIEFLDQHGDALPDLSAMCEIAHVSERTLQYAFRERYGVSPNAFVRSWQLNGARRLLRTSARQGKTVAAVAAQCGFHDPSVFARHYRLLHSELPSVTVANALR